MVSQNGGLATARQLLWTDRPSDSFAFLWEHGRLELTVEAARTCAVSLAASLTEYAADEKRPVLHEECLAALARAAA